MPPSPSQRGFTPYDTTAGFSSYDEIEMIQGLFWAQKRVSHLQVRGAPPRISLCLIQRRSKRFLPPQAEEALRKAARVGDLATLTRLVEEKVDVEAIGEVSASSLHPRTLCHRRCSSPPYTLRRAASRL